MELTFARVELDRTQIENLSFMATSIVREHFDPLIGKAQNDYMISKFQTVEAITSQIESGYHYYVVRSEDKEIGFLAFYPKGEVMYLSKFYLYKDQRGKGLAHQMLDFVVDETKKLGLQYIELNVNRHNSACKAYDHLGFEIVREEKNDIGSGFFMDDYVYRYTIR